MPRHRDDRQTAVPRHPPHLPPHPPPPSPLPTPYPNNQISRRRTMTRVSRTVVALGLTRRARRAGERRRSRPDPAQGLAPVARRQGRRARRDGADHRARGDGSRRRAGHPDLSRRVAVQAEPAVGRDGPGPARHLGLPARLRERQAPTVQRHPDAGPGQEPRARQAPERFAVHGGHQADHRRGGRDGAVGRLARRRLREQGRAASSSRRTRRAR